MFGVDDLTPGATASSSSTSSAGNTGGSAGYGGSSSSSSSTSGGGMGASGLGGAGATGGTSSTGGTGGVPECTGDGQCDDGDSCTVDSCDQGSCVFTDPVACGLQYRDRQAFSPHPTTGGSTDVIDIGPHDPTREIWCLLVGRTTNQLPDMESTTVSVGGVNLTQTSVTDPGLDVGYPAGWPGWYGRMASYRLPPTSQQAAGLTNQSSAVFTVSAADTADTYVVNVWSYHPAPGRLYRGVKGDHEVDADNVTTQTISPGMVVGGNVGAILASEHGSTDIVVLALSIATRATSSPAITSSSPFGGAQLTQHAGANNAAVGSADVHDYVPKGGTESWSSLQSSHPGANGVAMHVITAAYW